MVGCLLIAGTMLMPRVLLFVFWIIGHFEKADPWNTWLVPLIGFFVLPATTLTFGLCHVYSDGEFTIWWIIGMIAAVMYDMGSSSSAGAKSKRKRSR
jgi:hypothetical protein